MLEDLFRDDTIRCRVPHHRCEDPAPRRIGRGAATRDTRMHVRAPLCPGTNF